MFLNNGNGFTEGFMASFAVLQCEETHPVFFFLSQLHRRKTNMIYSYNVALTVVFSWIQLVGGDSADCWRLVL